MREIFRTSGSSAVLRTTIRLVAGLAPFLASMNCAHSGQAAGTLNPEEGGISQITQAMALHPDRIGILCWVVYEAQKGGLHEDAIAPLRQCANAGNEPSMILLSHVYENGLGVERSDEEATRWVRQAALRFYPTGQFHYKMALLNGKGTAKDEGQARFWLERVALGGDKDAAEALKQLGPAS